MRFVRSLVLVPGPVKGCLSWAEVSTVSPESVVALMLELRVCASEGAGPSMSSKFDVGTHCQDILFVLTACYSVIWAP